MLFRVVTAGGVGNKFDSADVTHPLGDPIPFEFAGRKGALQIFGNRRPRIPRHLRACYWLDEGCRLTGSLRLVSIPVGRVPLNPMGWEPIQGLQWPLAASFAGFASNKALFPLLHVQPYLEALRGLHEVFEGSPVSVTLSPGRIEVDKYCDAPGRVDRLRFLHRVTAFLESLPRVQPSSRTPLLQVLPELDLRDARCEVCACPVEGPFVACGGCGTPHHVDCWEYIGGCTTFACLCKEGHALDADGRPLEPQTA